MQNHDAQPPPRAPREIVFTGQGGWISGPSVTPPPPPPGHGLPALLRLVRYTATWSIAWHPEGPNWSAEKRQGTKIRYVAAPTTEQLADLIDHAEARP